MLGSSLKVHYLLRAVIEVQLFVESLEFYYRLCFIVKAGIPIIIDLFSLLVIETEVLCMLLPSSKFKDGDFYLN